MNLKNILLFLFVATLLSFQSLGAQTAGTGALTGTVKDPSGASVPSATITATSLDTGAVRMDMTGADGSYRFSLLPPGNYRALCSFQFEGKTLTSEAAFEVPKK